MLHRRILATVRVSLAQRGKELCNINSNILNIDNVGKQMCVVSHIL